MTIKRRIVATTFVLLCTLNNAAPAQQRAVVVAPGAEYQAGSFHQWLFGSGHRELWQTPVRVPVLNLRTFAGGLTAVAEGGGKQTRTLHMRGRDGRQYIFRSVNKHVDHVAPGLPVKGMLQDATSLFHPSGALMVPQLLRAIDVLHAVPRLYVMPVDERLGQFQRRYAGMLGYLEERPEEGIDSTIGFAKSKKIVGTEKLRAQLRDDSRHRVDEQDWLAARLTDFVIGDTDRGANQWRWARYQDDGGFRWRPIPRDRDFAFIHADGVGPRIVSRVLKRLVVFGDQLPPLGNLTFSTMHDDREFMQSMDGSAWQATTQRVQNALTDKVIEAAVRAMPPEHYALGGPQLAAELRERRAALAATARSFYARLAEHVDVQGSDQDERADIRRFGDGSVEVRVYQVEAAPIAARGVAANGNGNSNGNGHGNVVRYHEHPFYYRRFRPDETDEVRVYLHGGDDSAVITGPNTKDAIKIRIIGGAGADALIDTSTDGAGGTNTWLYDEAGLNELSGGKHAAIDRRPFREPEPKQTITDKKRYRDWGSTHALTPLLDYRTNTGFIVGMQYGERDYGFRRVPFESQWRARLMYAPGAGAFGAELGRERYFENSPWSVTANVRASGYDNLRFFGYGNDSPDIETDSALVEWQHARATVGVRHSRGATDFALGVAAQVSETPVDEGTPLALTQPLGTGDWTQYGVWTELASAFAGRNAKISVGGAYYPAAGTQDESYGTARGSAVVYIGSAPTLALRAIGEKVWGDAPFQDAAFIGGRRSLRGYASYRFAGDASVLGNAELRIPIAGETFGVFLLADAGRVYMDGASPGGWHTAQGGGLWVSALGQAVSLTYANGADSKLYLMLGMPF
jgi:hypothetical protein